MKRARLIMVLGGALGPEPRAASDMRSHPAETRHVLAHRAVECASALTAQAEFQGDARPNLSQQGS
jgi:hypothetical protein